MHGIDQALSKQSDIVTRTFTGSSGNRLVADIGGDPAAPAVMLLHGGGQTRHSWGGTQRQLIASGYRVISLDARGHGESEWIADGDYSLDAQVGDVAAVATQLGGRPALVGASMGGVNSLIACGRYASLASALVLVDVAPRLEPEGVEHIHRFMSANPHGFSSIEEAGDAVAAYNPSRPRPKNLDGLGKNLRLRDDGRWYWHWDPKFIAGDRPSKLAGVSLHMNEACSSIRIPTMLVRGKQSDVVSMEGVEELRSRLLQLEFVDIQGAGHMIAGDKNDVFGSAVLDFLQRHLPGG